MKVLTRELRTKIRVAAIVNYFSDKTLKFFFTPTVTFLSKRRIISAMVIAPLSWCREEWVDYTFGANLAPCLISILEKNASRLRPSITDRENANGSLMVAIFTFFTYMYIHIFFFA